MAASKSSASIALFVGLNLLFFALVSGCGSCPNPKPNPKPKPSPNPKPKPSPSNPNPKPSPNPNPKPSPSTGGKCPRDALKLGVCAKLLGGLVNVIVGSQSTKPCCSLIQGLADVEAAACLCTAIKANVLGINLNVPLALTLLLNACSMNNPSDFKCV